MGFLLKIIISLFAIVTHSFFSVSFFAQTTAVSNMAQNLMYLKKENELHIIQESTPCSSLKVSTDNGRLSRTGPCKYSYVPDRLGMGQIVVTGHKGTYNYLVRVEDFNTVGPEIYIGKNRNGIISKNDLMAQLGVLIKVNGSVPDNFIKVKSYSMMIVRDDKVMKTFRMSTPRFSQEQKEALSGTITNDQVVIFNVVTEDQKGNTYIITPAEFIIR